MIATYQTLITGVLAIIAAIITAVAIMRAANAPLKAQKINTVEELDKKATYTKLRLENNLRQLAKRAKNAVGTVKVVKGAGATVTDIQKNRMELTLDPIMKEWDKISLLDVEITKELLRLERLVDDSNFDVERAGGSFGDDNFGKILQERFLAIEKSASAAADKLAVIS